MKKKIPSVCIVMLLLAFLLLNPTEATAGSRAGLMLWFHSVLPVLLPFIILSRLLISMDGLSFLIKRITPLTRRLFGVTPMGTYALIFGFLCGYPMGAKLSGDLVREGRISREEGEYLLLFCNNVSPAFLLGFSMTEHVKAPGLIPLTLALVYGTPLVLALFWRKGRCFPDIALKNTSGLPSRPTEAATGSSFRMLRQQKQTSGFQMSFKIVDACIMDGLESILKLGCYIILFSIMARLAALIPWHYALSGALFAGLLEITGGIAAVCALPLPLLTRYLAVTGFMVFGGLSGIAQTNGMLVGSGLPIGAYVRSKILTSLLALLLAFLFLTFLPGSGPPL